MAYDLELVRGEEIVKEITGDELEGKYFGNMMIEIFLFLTVIGIPLAILVGVLTAHDKKKTRYYITTKRVVKQESQLRGIKRKEARYSEIEDIYTDQDEYGPWENNKARKVGIRLENGDLIKLENLPDAKEIKSRISHHL